MTKNTILVTLVGLAALLLGACVPLNPNTTMADGTAMEMPAAGDGMDSGVMEDDGSAIATVITRSLRVREAPEADAEVVAGVREGETFKVLSLSSDGQWVQIAVDRAPEGSGWVAANFVSVNGAVSGDAEGLVLVPTAPAAEEVMTGDGEAEIEPTPLPAPEPGFAMVATDGTRLRVRAEADADSEIVGYVYAGETYEVLGRTDDGLWLQIAGSSEGAGDNPNGGWVAAEFMLVGE